MQKYMETFKIKTYDTDFQRRATSTALLGFMQEVATNHAQSLGLGYHDSFDHGFIWILRASKYELKRIPMLEEQIEVYTWPAGLSGLKALRRFEFRVDGELIGQGYNHWLMLDISKNKPVVSDYFMERMEILNISKEEAFRLPRISPLIDKVQEHTQIIDHSLLDWNMHVNNVRYADIITRALPFEFVQQNDILSFHIEYLKECKLRDEIAIASEKTDNVYFLEGTKEDETMFRVSLEWKEKE